MTLAKKLRKRGAMPKRRPAHRAQGTVWKGPEKDGITQSLLARWLSCRERARLLLVEGLREVEAFSHRLHYGQMWHTCEEATAAGQPWYPALVQYMKELCVLYPLQQEQIHHWTNVCNAQYPVYLDYWARHPETQHSTTWTQEEVFNVPYPLPSGRTVRLRGKWDAVYVLGKGKTSAVYLRENKTKGEIKEQQLNRQMTFDLQTMLYLVALGLLSLLSGLPAPIGGVIYNVVLRPLSGGRHSIKPLKGNSKTPPESMEAFYKRLQREHIAEDPEFFFMRWTVGVVGADITKFRTQFLDPCLEQLCDWWGWVSSPHGREDPFADPCHFRTPYGFYNPLAEGRVSETDEYLATGSEAGLERVTNLFRELV